MEQRPLRLGDIVDDYCPRERRITNHVIAALMGDTVQQTRCSTCDVEHAYKAAKVPTRKKKEVVPLETAVLASVNGTQLVARVDPTVKPDPVPAPVATPVAAAPTHPAPHAAPKAASASVAPAPETPAAADEPPATGDPIPGGWIGHRTLIRASLPRTEGEVPPARPIPEFTMHQRQPQGRPPFRGGGGGWGGHDRGRGPRQNFSHGGNGNGSNGNGNRNGGEVNGNTFSYGNSYGNHHNPRRSQGPNFGHGQNAAPHHNGGPRPNPNPNPAQGEGQGNGQPQGQGRPPGQGRRRHRHGKNRRPPQQ